MFNPNPDIRAIPISPGQRCLVVDNVLSDPQAWVDRAALHRADFELTGHNAYPGLELRMPDPVSERLSEFFSRHIRHQLGARRIERVHSRLALVTHRPEQLQPPQWICHRDRMGLGPSYCIGASVLYLFHDAALGGTNFFVPKRPMSEIELMVHESGTLSADQFSAKYGVARGYLTTSNHWFDKVLSVAPAWNRMIFYDGSLFHCSDIPQPERLSFDPHQGRLTLNGFFTCTRRAS
jgi:hypothetical protein